jgi:hypothetical protein
MVTFKKSVKCSGNKDSYFFATGHIDLGLYQILFILLSSFAACRTLEGSSVTHIYSSCILPNKSR